jgi:hypothetical protein
MTCNTEDLRRPDDTTCISIPPRDGVFTIKHELPRKVIDAVDLKNGERCMIKIGNKFLGTRWWAYGDLENLEGIRLRQWYDVEAYEAEERRQPSLKRTRAREYQEVIERLGHGPTSIGEKPDMLELIRENEGAEFEIVRT